MPALKSQTELLGMYKALMQDMVRHYGNLLFTRDFRTIENRVKNEGISFFTKTLPILGKAIDTALVNGSLTCPSNFKRSKNGSALPAFLQGLLRLVFNEDGSVKVDPCVSAVRDLRQILFLLYKYELTPSQEVEQKIYDNFKTVDQNLQNAGFLDLENWSYEHTRVVRIARTLLNDLLHGVEFTSISPNHGPGAVATGEKNWEKMEFKNLYDSIHQKFPYYNYFYSHVTDLAMMKDHYMNLNRYKYGLAKVVLVPKDSRGPRLISMEPLEFQWIQQGVRKILYQHIEHHPLTRGHVSFTDQNINRDLALLGSMSNDIVTLDMKEASDRISLRLFDVLFDGTSLKDVVHATRTIATELPDHIVYMNKIAPMGSALCFPIMSMVHWALAVSTLTVYNKIAMKQAIKAVYVYGDDIIIKGENHMPLLNTFPFFGMLFNEKKCCTKGIFRESCGMDAVLGVDVSVMKIKKLLPSSPYDAMGYIAYIDYINYLWNNAYYSTSEYLERLVSKTFKNIPYVDAGADVPGLYTRICPPKRQRFMYQKRWNTNLQIFEYKTRKPMCKKHYAQMDRCEYLRTLTQLVERPPEVNPTSVSSAGIYTVPRRIKLKQGWSRLQLAA